MEVGGSTSGVTPELASEIEDASAPPGSDSGALGVVRRHASLIVYDENSRVLMERGPSGVLTIPTTRHDPHSDTTALHGVL